MMDVKKYLTLAGVTLISAVTLMGCADADASYKSFIEKLIPQEEYKKAPEDAYFAMNDKDDLYEEPLEDNVVYLTVGMDADGKGAQDSWSELNAHDLTWYEENDREVAECDALLQFGNEVGPTLGSYGYGNISPNSKVRLSGKNASTKQQRSYRIKINSGSGNVDGIKTLILSKGFGDPFRFANKLSYDLMTEVDDLLSTRTEFVHLYVRDVSKDDNALFVDYGLYTMIETVNKKYLSNRDLDSSGELYKVNDFDFGRHEDVIMQPTEAGFDQEEFEKMLEAKGSSDYSGLIELLDAVNDPESDIYEVVNKYFYKDNLYSWMAFNILMDNKNVDMKNFYLYSPTGSGKFYIISWDNDSVLRSEYELIRDENYSAGWERGIYLFNDSLLFGRMMKDERCINDLSEKVTALYETALSPANVSSKANEFAEEVKEYLYELPDSAYARVTKDKYDTLLESIPLQIEDNYYAYYDSIETPWPFHINEPLGNSTDIVINWDASSVLNGNVTYDVEVSDSWDFDRKLFSREGLSDTSVSIGALDEGQYFVRVTARSDRETGLTQEAYEYYNSEKKSTIHGVMCFYVKKDGTIEKSIFN